MDNTSVAAADRAVVNAALSEPDCSAHPFDMMAIYALYQSLP